MQKLALRGENGCSADAQPLLEQGHQEDNPARVMPVDKAAAG
jgi:hypothetical protein